jgi:hypothetical protein
MKPLAAEFVPVGVARDYTELQAYLREIADQSGKSRQEIDERAGLPDRFASKALASVPIGTCRLGAKTLGKMLRELDVVLIVAKATRPLIRAADSAVKRREEQVRTRLLSNEVFAAAKTRLARENGKLGAKGYFQKVPKKKRQRIARRAIRIRWKRARLAARKDPKLMVQVISLPAGRGAD